MFGHVNLLGIETQDVPKQSYTELYRGRTREEGRERDGRTEITEWIGKVWSDNLWRAEDRNHRVDSKGVE